MDFKVKKFILVTIFSLVLTLSFAVSSPSSHAAQSCPTKSMIVITINELQWSKISKEQTPYLNSFASQSHIASLTPGRVPQYRIIGSSFSTINAGTRTFDTKPFPKTQATGKNSY